ncbi:autotransporter domain-containing protein [Bradyrhizobium sp. CSA112]|uniref:autotransporter outer membrane beta-barrel domain-containing protein n=1 Tax=Bradyrhizobium sp. CSA112 TaxID=2699170 RepID=UPI0023AEC479|nr:autotransporter domain-containing protein [Bradyrhizobium sp. CSA112]MDE5457355.1 autotransporter domain-containing protein [Bradyrhizobium sp. CSA112]
MLGTAAIGALWLMEPRPAQAGPGGCTTVGATASCTGDQSAGIGAADFDQTVVDTLNVNSLTTNIAPAAGTSGIDFERPTGAVTINSDIAPHSITVTGAADGIRASSSAMGSWETGVVTINHTGDISSAGGFGIHASTVGLFGNADISITSSGTIAAYRDGIYGRANVGHSGDIVVTHNGDISSGIGSGIYAESSNQTVSVTSVGNINAANIGIWANGTLSATVDSVGDIAAKAGIIGSAAFSDVTIAHSGNISSLFGIQAEAGRSVRITHEGGNITSDRMAIFAAAIDDIYITNRGNLIGNDYGIIASAQIGANVDSIGDITSHNGSGMYLVGTAAVVVTSRGNIRALDYGIYALMGGVGYYVAVDSTGDITSSGSEGIHADANAGYTSVISRGNVSAYGDGIHAGSVGDTTVNSTGNVTSLTGNAIYAGAGGNIGVTVNGGVVSGAQAGINLDGGATNTLTIGSTATVTGGLYAITAGAGNDMVNNSGTVTGNVGLGGGTNAFNNLSGSVFNSGTTVDLGAGNMLSNSGTLAPLGVGTVGSTTLTGNFVQNAGGKFAVDVDLAGQTADRLNVSGTASLTGKVVVDPLARVSATTTYTIMTAGTLSGTFSGVDFLTASSFARNARLTYVGNDVLLTLDPGLLSSSLLGNANINQRNVAAGIDNALIGGATMPASFNALFALSGNALLDALTQASGETATGTQQTTFNAMNLFMGVLTDPFVAGRGDPRSLSGVAMGYSAGDSDALAYAGGRKRSGAEREAYAAISRKAPPAQAFESRWSVWAAGFGGTQTTDGNGALGSNTATSRIAGVTAGADYWFSPLTVAGFALAGGGTSFSVANGGTGRSDLFQAGAFVRHNAGPAYVMGALAYGWQDVTTDRTVTIAGADHLQARFNANASSGRLEGGYRLIAPWIGSVGFTPYAAAQFTTFDLPAYAEQAITGTDTFALSYASKSVTDTRSEFGLRTDKSFSTADGIATLRGRIAWAHNFNSDRSIGATFQALPGSSFVVNGAAQAADATLVTASAEKKWLNGWSAAATFEGEFSNVTRSYAGKGVVRYQW